MIAHAPRIDCGLTQLNATEHSQAQRTIPQRNRAELSSA